MENCFSLLRVNIVPEAGHEMLKIVLERKQFTVANCSSVIELRAILRRPVAIQ